ncbi:MAG: hypothetical protein E7D92_02385 [Anaerococcus sp.]|uniref:hypothetical protein n=1 Tax=Anaerococcus sp. TaxID=1872515 RepID=UPI00290395DD|nr:hypothetical protein [Anaerococcus sp.]MDU1828551.1 hypothetical protein [Anaerococcus sp.]MDU1864827.1 hypothetical protein [Anaerococcus sp.]MDU2353428.1 hypothetical protein [Anaerococcus sp.]
MFANKVLIANDIRIKKRQFLKLIKNYPLILILIPAIFAMAIFYADKYIIYYIPLVDKSLLTTSLALLIALYGFLSRKSLIRIDHAHLLYLNDEEIVDLLRLKFLKKAGIYIIVFYPLNILLKLGNADIALIFLTLVYQDILGLFFYNLKDKKLANIFRFSLILMLVLLYFNYKLIIVVFFIILTELIILAHKFRLENLDKDQLFKEFRTYNTIQSAARNKDYSKMQVINKQNLANKGRSYSYFNKLNYKNAISQQALLSLRRTSFRTIIGFAIVIYILLAINKFYLDKDFINIFMIYSYLTNINTMICENFKSVLIKARQGLFIDVEYKNLVKSYSIINFTINTIFLLGFSIILKKIYYLVISLVYAPMLVASIYFSKDNKKIITYLSPIYLLAILLLFQNLL